MNEIDQLDKAGNSQLMIAAAKGDGELVAKLLNDGADPTVKDRNGVKASHRARNKGHSEIEKLLQSAENDWTKKPNNENKPSKKITYEAPVPVAPDTKNESSDYKTSIIIAKLVSAVGWITCAFSLIVVAISVSENGRMGLLSLAPMLGTFLGGLILVMAGQATRAIMDNANYSKQMLEEMRK